MHPLLDRLVTELGWPHLTSHEQVAAFLARPGAHCLLIPGDAAVVHGRAEPETECQRDS